MLGDWSFLAEILNDPRRLRQLFQDRSCVLRSVIRTCNAIDGEIAEVALRFIQQHRATESGYDAPAFGLKHSQAQMLVSAMCIHDFISHQHAWSYLHVAKEACGHQLRDRELGFEQWIGTFLSAIPWEEKRKKVEQRLRLVAKWLVSVFFDSLITQVEDDLFQQQWLPLRRNRVARIVRIRDEIHNKSETLRECAERLRGNEEIADLKRTGMWRLIRTLVRQASGESNRVADQIVERAARDAKAQLRDADDAECPPQFYRLFGFQVFRDSLLDQLTDDVIRSSFLSH